MAKVIFLQNIRNVAQIGDTKVVADGYARNFLLPRRLAILVTDEALKIAERLKEKRVLEAQKEEKIMAGLIEKLINYTLNIEKAVNEDGTLYAGVNSAEISSQLKKEGFFIEPEQIILENSLKKIGTYEVEINFEKNKKATLKLEIKKQSE